MSKIEWGEPVDVRPGQPRISGRIGDLRVAEVWPNREKPGKWWVTVFLGPLPERLDDMTLECKASERQAKATAQRVVNTFIKILTGEKS